MNLHSLSCRGCSQVGTTDSITVGQSHQQLLVYTMVFGFSVAFLLIFDCMHCVSWCCVEVTSCPQRLKCSVVLVQAGEVFGNLELDFMKDVIGTGECM